MKRAFSILGVLMAGCSFPAPGANGRMVPAEEFTKAYHSGQADQFSIFRVEEDRARAQLDYQLAAQHPQATQMAYNSGAPGERIVPVQNAAGPQLGQEYAEKGYSHHGGMSIPSPQIAATRPQMIPAALQPPPASSAPYQQGQMTSNPSLYPDEGQGASLFRDFRAFQPMDVITILVKETQEGKKKAETDTETKFSLEAAIKEFFGLETKKWTSNNASLDPSELISATTNNKFEGTGETTRSGSLRGNISAVIMEVLPNGLLRIEGSKIISVNSEEEIMVISGLVRQRDVLATNEVASSRIANMRIDFYGQGVVADKQSPGWGARIFDTIWPF